jgi:hypothetical protein
MFKIVSLKGMIHGELHSCAERSRSMTELTNRIDT